MSKKSCGCLRLIRFCFFIILLNFCLFINCVFAEISEREYFQLLDDAINNSDTAKFVSLVQNNPNTTKKIMDLFESRAKSAPPSESRRLNAIIKVLKGMVSSVHNDESNWNVATQHLEEGKRQLNVSDFEGAIKSFETALPYFQKIPAKRAVAATLGMLGITYDKAGVYFLALDYLNQALVISEEINDKDKSGEIYGHLGTVYTTLDDYPNALENYYKALQFYIGSGDINWQGSTYGNIGVVYRRMGDYAKAIEYQNKALILFAKSSNNEGDGNTLANIGGLYLELGNYSKGIEYLNKALKKFITDKNIYGEVTVLTNIGVGYANTGDYNSAIKHYETALAFLKDSNLREGQAAELTNGVYNNLGDVFLVVDREEESFKIFNKFNNYIGLGKYYLKKMDFINAAHMFSKDIELYERLKKTGIIIPLYIGIGLSNEGMSNYEEAYKWFNKAVALMEEQRSTLSTAEREHYFEGKEVGFPRLEAYEGSVRCAFMLNRPDEAFYWAENTRGRVTSELLSTRHSDGNAKIPTEFSKEEKILTDKIRLNKKQRQSVFLKSNHEILKQLETEYITLKTKMDNFIDRLRKEYPQYAAIKYPQPVKLSQLALKPGETIIEYEVTDPYTIGMVIRDGKVVTSFKVDKTRKELDALVKKFREPFQEGADINSFSLKQATQLATLLIKPALTAVKKGDHIIIVPDESLALLPFESLLLSASVVALKEEATLLALATKQAEGDTVDKASIIRGLAKESASRGGTRVATRVSIRILFDSGTAQVKLESGNQLKEILAALTSNELKDAIIRIEGHTDSVGDAKFNLRLSQKRAKTIYEYLTNNGIPAEHLNFIGKGDTEQIASNSDEKGRKQNRRVDFVRINTAATNQKAAPANGFVYAMDEYPISYYQSASVLSLQRGLKIKRSTDKSFFGLGDPIFDNSDSRSTGIRGLEAVAKDQPSGCSEIANNEETKDAGYQFGRLLNTEKEVKEVGKLFSNAKLLTGADASEEKLKGEDLSAKRYLLFSTHGILGNEIPYIKQPALVLNLVGNNKEDGFLTASEIFNMNLNADVVCLSACKTGLGVQSAGEGVVGLSRAFMYAGTDTVLVSLWSVADESTYKLMVKFFEGLKSGKDKMTALKDAKNYLRTSGYDNPYYWAPFILMGEAN